MKKLLQKIKKFFKSKRIIYSTVFAPAEFVTSFTGSDGKKYIRIAVTNKQKIRGHNPTTDIFIHQVYGIRKLPSPFKIWAFKKVGLPEPKANYYSKYGINKKNN